MLSEGTYQTLLLGHIPRCLTLTYQHTNVPMYQRTNVPTYQRTNVPPKLAKEAMPLLLQTYRHRHTNDRRSDIFGTRYMVHARYIFGTRLRVSERRKKRVKQGTSFVHGSSNQRSASIYHMIIMIHIILILG